MRKTTMIVFLTLLVLTTLAQEKREMLVINWPEEYKWKVGSNQENDGVHMMELIPGNETIDKWTIIGTMMSVKGAKEIKVDAAMNLMYKQAKQNAPEATLTMIERRDSGKNPWIIFKIESPRFKDDSQPESQLYYIILGDTSLYSNFVAIRKKNLSLEFVDKWQKVFKASELVYQ
jgi:hypothetical protein